MLLHALACVLSGILNFYHFSIRYRLPSHSICETINHRNKARPGEKQMQTLVEHNKTSKTIWARLVTIEANGARHVLSTWFDVKNKRGLRAFAKSNGVSASTFLVSPSAS
jgi:hypothetical protein